MASEGRSFEVEVKGAKPNVVWKYLDFATIDKVAPDIESCTVVDGAPGEPGCTRYVVLKPIPGPDSQPLVMNLTERLVSIDHHELSFRYEALESSFGFVGYMGQGKVIDNGDEDSKIRWSFQAESFGQWSADLILVLMKTLVQGVARTIERAVEEGTT